MDSYEVKTGGSVLAIAHNGNLSNGQMFPMIEAFGKSLDREYAETQAKWERLYEATQTKGDGEAHPFLSPTDEFADFETWDKGNLDASVFFATRWPSPSVPTRRPTGTLRRTEKGRSKRVVEIPWIIEIALRAGAVERIV